MLKFRRFFVRWKKLYSILHFGKFALHYFYVLNFLYILAFRRRGERCFLPDAPYTLYI